MLNSDELPVASDQECAERRAELIRGGVVRSDKNSVLTKRDGTEVLSTKKVSCNLRDRLIRQGIITPNFSYTPVLRPRLKVVPEEGQYFSKEIKTDQEYERRKEVYLWLISDILHTRKNLKLILGKKLDSDPDWYF